MDTPKMGLDGDTRLWLAGVAGGAEVFVLKPENPDSASPLLVCIDGPSGDPICLEAYLDDDNGALLIDLGWELRDFAAGQGGERPTGADLDQRSAPVTLNLRSAERTASADPAARRAPLDDHSGHRIQPRADLASNRYGVWCETCNSWAAEPDTTISGFLRKTAQEGGLKD